ncbi:glutathione ABC transporter substrate-binding protein [Paenibacillus thalictri]|uniref:Glutathione ABC transporter substrate-binding protein n=1 Tax=Paenibacillus thalictri TaxID=2527873 RepID=A0A4Q9DME1_9BACL|nr:glutathione ABC transporter substrate-binding protein [Paenibacillus thalictri]TBL75259.1 glutathione ABC transporter substrate-binding protein [Paenibacillus thalictri]
MKKTLSILALSLMLVISACSSSQPSAGGSATGAAEPKDLIVAFGSEPVTLDPQDTSDGISNNANELIFDKLVTLDKDNKIVPQLAKEWEISPDGKKITFKLREGVKFTDGTPVNAEAVKYTFDRVINKDNKLNRYSLYAEFIDKVNADSEYQVSFDLKFPFGPALISFAHTNGGIHSMKNLKEKGKDVGKSPVGSGPYKMKEWVPGNKLVFEANNDYWGDKPKSKTITFKPVPENSARSIMLETGEADIIVPVVTTDVDRLKSNDKVKVLVEPSSRNLYMSINTTRAPFDNPKARQALNYAVDKETIVKKIMSGQAKVAEAAVGELVWGFSSVGAYPYDPEKAKQLLAEAGVQPGTTIKLWTPDGRYLMDRQIAEFIQGNLQAVGLKVEFRKWEFGAFQEATRDPKAEFNLALNSWGASTNDADWGLRPILMTKGASNYSKLANPEIDALIDKGMKSANADERKKVYVDALKLIKDQAPWIFLLDYKQTTGYRSNLENVYSWNNERLILRDVVKK